MNPMFALKNAASSLLIACLAAGLAGFAHAQNGGATASGQMEGVQSGQGASTGGAPIKRQRILQGEGTKDTTGKGTSGQENSHPTSKRKKGAGSTDQLRGTGASGTGSGASQGSGGSAGNGGY